MARMKELIESIGWPFEMIIQQQFKQSLSSLLSQSAEDSVDLMIFMIPPSSLQTSAISLSGYCCSSSTYRSRTVSLRDSLEAKSLAGRWHMNRVLLDEIMKRRYLVCELLRVCCNSSYRSKSELAPMIRHRKKSWVCLVLPIGNLKIIFSCRKGRPWTLPSLRRVVFLIMMLILTWV